MRYPLFLVRQLSRTLSKKLVRTGARHLPFVSKERTRRLERWLRGREDWRKLRLADAVVVSFGKSGRTWLRVLLSRVYQLQHGLGERAVIGFDNLHYQADGVPKIMFTHDNYVKDYTGQRDSKADFYDKKVVFLARDPRDVAVSQYFQWKYRMKPNKKDINAYPSRRPDAVRVRHVRCRPAQGDRVHELVGQEARQHPGLHDRALRGPARPAARDPGAGAGSFSAPREPRRRSRMRSDFASYDNMKQMEQQRVFWLSGGRLVPKDRSNPNSYKVRRGKVAGYRDDFDAAQLAADRPAGRDHPRPALRLHRGGRPGRQGQRSKARPDPSPDCGHLRHRRRGSTCPKPPGAAAQIPALETSVIAIDRLLRFVRFPRPLLTWVFAPEERRG